MTSKLPMRVLHQISNINPSLLQSWNGQLINHHGHEASLHGGAFSKRVQLRSTEDRRCHPHGRPSHHRWLLWRVPGRPHRSSTKPSAVSAGVAVGLLLGGLRPSHARDERPRAGICSEFSPRAQIVNGLTLLNTSSGHKLVEQWFLDFLIDPTSLCLRWTKRVCWETSISALRA